MPISALKFDLAPNGGCRVQTPACEVSRSRDRIEGGNGTPCIPVRIMLEISVAVNARFK